jgi:hypothetical protein
MAALVPECFERNRQRRPVPRIRREQLHQGAEHLVDGGPAQA